MKDIKYTHFLVLITTLFLTSCISKKFQYTIDLYNLKNNQLQIELECPKIDQNTALFQFVKMDPGQWTNEVGRDCKKSFKKGWNVRFGRGNCKLSSYQKWK